MNLNGMEYESEDKFEILRQIRVYSRRNVGVAVSL
jgi:hypothetical protein